MKLSLALSSLLISLSRKTEGVLYGDEQFGNIEGGRFWVFNSNGVAIVNPDTCKVEETITSDLEGGLLPGRWYDGIYMENCPEEENPKTKCKKYIAINSAITLSDTHGEAPGAGEVIFFDVDKVAAVSRVIVGPRPVHSYGVYTHNEYWTHSDGDGFFYVVDLNDIDGHTGKPIKAKIDEAYHGKLLWDESDLLQDTGYATSTGEPHLFIMDMKTHEQVGTFDFSAQPGCFGSHAIAFAKANQHLYIECTGFGGMLEVDVSSPRSPVLVKQHMGITGAMYEAPDETYITVTDKGASKFHLIQPGDSGISSSVDHTLDIYGHPSTPVWYPGDGDSAGNYKVCLSLTVNTNKNHYNGDGELVCDYYGCSQAQSSTDVDSGICLYDTKADGTVATNLLKVNTTNIANVKSGVAPYNQACTRCENLNNYDEEDATCICTPTCGSCAANEQENHDGDLSGAVCLDLNKVIQRDLVQSGDDDTVFVPAGGVKQGSSYGGTDCGFGRTYRSHKRGGVYDAIPTDYPKPSLSLVDMRDFKMKCAVELPGDPFRIIYVPPTGENKSSSLSTGSIVGIVFGAFVALSVIAATVLFVFKGKKSSAQGTEGQTNGFD